MFTLRRYFPAAQLTGLDIDPLNIARCRSRASKKGATGMTFVAAATTEKEHTESYDAIFCLAVLCHGDLTNSGAARCDHLLRFDSFERMVVDFARCLKPDGLLLLLTTNFRFCDTVVAEQFDVVLEADQSQLAPDVLFDRDNNLMKGVCYRNVAFRKRQTVASGANTVGKSN